MSGINHPLFQEFKEFIDAQGFQFFSAAEIVSNVGNTKVVVKNGVKTTYKNEFPPRALWPNIVPVIRVLDKLRREIGIALKISSAYRSPAYNAAIKGAKASQHLKFKAVDFMAYKPELRAKFNPRVLHRLAMRFRNEGRFKGGLGVYPTFVHIDTRGHNANWG